MSGTRCASIQRSRTGCSPGADLGDVRTFVRFHHERFDGSGYPNGLVGEQIPIESRIIAVANALDCMIHDRPYRIAIPFRDAVREIRGLSGTQFCPEVVAALDAAGRAGSRGAGGRAGAGTPG